MGNGDSKEQHDSSASYANADEETVEDVPSLYTGPIHSLCVVDEERLLSGGADKDVLLYQWTNHVNVARFRGPTKDVTQVVYNPRSSLIHAASRDRTIYQWKWPPDDVETTGNDSHVNTSSPSPLGVVQSDASLQGHTLGVTALACDASHDNLLFSGSRDNSVCLWDLTTGKPISSTYIPRNLVTGLQWIEQEKAVLQSSEDKTLRVWDLRSCSVTQHFRARQHVQSSSAIAHTMWRETGKWVTTGGAFATAIMGNGRARMALVVETCCAISEDGSYFLGGSAGGELTLWDRRQEKKFVREYRGHTESVHGCRFLSVEIGSKEHNLIASVGSDSTVKLWGRESGDVQHSEYLSGAGPVTSVVSPQPGLIACSSFKGGVFIWTMLTVDTNSILWTLNVRAKY